MKIIMAAQDPDSIRILNVKKMAKKGLTNDLSYARMGVVPANLALVESIALIHRNRDCFMIRSCCGVNRPQA